MPIPHFGPLPRAVAGSAVMAALLAGCAKSVPSTPNVDQVAHTLQTQVYKLLDATWTTGPRITDALFDKYVPCGDGKVKVTYAVAGKPVTFATRSIVSTNAAKRPAAPTQIIDDLVRYIPQIGSFSIEKRADHGTTVKLVSTGTRTRLTLHSPGPGRLVISGETDCLTPGNLGRDIG
jgi:hypothetical protein